MFHEALNGATFTGCISAFKKNNHALPGFLNPSLQLQQFHLKGKLFLFVRFAIETIFVWIDSGAPIFNQNIVGIIHSRTGCRVI